MTTMLRCEFYSRLKIVTDPALFARLWSFMAGGLVKADKFDSFERTRKKFEPDPARAHEVAMKHLMIYARSSKTGFVASAQTVRHGLSLLTIKIPAVAYEREPAWREWLYRLIGELPVLFGSGSTQEEHDAKHADNRDLPGGGYVKGWVGASVADFVQFLPGVYWLTVFGPDLTSELDLDGVARLPVTVAHLANGQTALELREPIVPADMTARLDGEARVADAIGPTYFFDRRRELEFGHPPKFRAVMEELAK